MKYHIYLLLLPLILIILAGCRDFTSPDRFEGETYTVTGLLIAGQPIGLERPIYVTRSTSIQDFQLLELFVSDAEVKIIDLDTGTEFQLIPALHDFKIKYIDPDENLIQPEHTYRLEVTIPGHQKLIGGETTVPKQVTLTPDFYGWNVTGQGYTIQNQEPYPEITYDTVESRYPLALETGSYIGALNLYAEMYCLEEFSTALEFTTPVFGQTNPDTTMVNAYYSAREGIRRIQFFGKYTSIPHQQPAGNFMMIKDYRMGFIFFGRYRVSLFSCDDNYFRYKYSPEGYFHGGIRNALGYFGSASGGSMYTRIVKDYPPID
ncbi:MAG: DUF4249 family protein [Candidatus Cloacimonetes bacterium]|nr:DUF4249 family protein [Candidatus Cloacimonadota bacterium]